MHVLQTGSFKSKKEGKDQKLIQSPHLTQDTTWESNKITLNITHKRAKRLALLQQWPQGYNEHTWKHDKPETQIRKMIHKRSAALERSVLLEGSN